MKIQTEVKLDSAHRLPKYKGKCSNLHGHTWRVVITIKGECAQNGMLVDFVKIKDVMKKYDHILLNDLIYNPTAENLTMLFAYEIKELGEVGINPGYNRFDYVKIQVYESEKSFAEITI